MFQVLFLFDLLSSRQCDHRIAAVKDQVYICMRERVRLWKNKLSVDSIVWSIQMRFILLKWVQSCMRTKNGNDQLNADYCHRKMISFTHNHKRTHAHMINQEEREREKKTSQPTIFLSPEKKNKEINRL